MYAIIKTGGKQYRVTPGESLRVEKLAGDVGSRITLDQVLMVGGEGITQLGRPMVDGASVTAEIVRQGRAKKVIVFKKRRRKGYRRRQGHRQAFTELRITGVDGSRVGVAESSTEPSEG